MCLYVCVFGELFGLVGDSDRVVRRRSFVALAIDVALGLVNGMPREMPRYSYITRTVFGKFTVAAGRLLWCLIFFHCVRTTALEIRVFFS